ncbi:MAG: non-canonical purine NTP pyrophosphatase, partial [Thermoplasmatales archaeon]|nr:non-canonical purine NTP pyrophosphatase [Thermoplasmatales archaeon]
DPIFSPDGKISFAEMPLDEKNLISHRGRAIGLLKKELSTKGLI